MLGCNIELAFQPPQFSGMPVINNERRLIFCQAQSSYERAGNATAAEKDRSFHENVILRRLVGGASAIHHERRSRHE